MNIVVFEPAEWGQTLSLGDERAIHIRDILKLDVGQSLRVALLGQGSGKAVYRGIAGDKLSLDFPEIAALEAVAPLLPITVILGHPRPPVMQRLLKDLNAAGIARIFVVASDLSEKSYMQSRLWQADSRGQNGCLRFLVQGAQQGGLASLSQVRRFYSVNRAIDAVECGLPFSSEPFINGAVWELPEPAPKPVAVQPVPNQALRWMLDLEEGGHSLLARAATLATQLNAGESLPDEGIVLAIGPERGWTDRERELLKNRGFLSCSLGNTILRTETACILSCGVLAMALPHGR